MYCDHDIILDSNMNRFSDLLGNRRVKLLGLCLNRARLDKVFEDEVSLLLLRADGSSPPAASALLPTKKQLSDSSSGRGGAALRAGPLLVESLADWWPYFTDLQSQLAATHDWDTRYRRATDLILFAELFLGTAPIKQEAMRYLAFVHTYRSFQNALTEAVDSPCYVSGPNDVRSKTTGRGYGVLEFSQGYQLQNMEMITKALQLRFEEFMQDMVNVAIKYPTVDGMYSSLSV
jgi:hypothetical protein